MYFEYFDVSGFVDPKENQINYNCKNCLRKFTIDVLAYLKKENILRVDVDKVPVTETDGDTTQLSMTNFGVSVNLKATRLGYAANFS